ncbi:MAG: AAA family ATPase [Gemmatimonadales bacterium]|jgi:class 3 adenylate cyclase/tetratricopeptide (TPR) repeat protein
MQPDAPPPDAEKIAVLASFLPRERLRHLVRSDLPAGPRIDRMPGAVLFVDVAGFTRLTERLGQLGAAGSEELSKVIDSCFGRMTDVVVELGGDVVVYAGDAMLAIWPAADESELADATRLAAQAARRAQDDRGGSDESGESLRLRASVGCGSLCVLEVGGVENRWLYLVGGQPLSDVFAADDRAVPGDIVLTPSARESLGAACAGTGLPGGFFRLDALVAEPAASRRPTPAVPRNRVERVRACVPPFLAARLEAGREDWLAEFRNLSVVFIALDESPADPSMDRLQAAFERIQRAVTETGGSVYQALVDDKGVGAVAAFGLPTQARENDAARAIRCATTASRELRAAGFRGSIGVATGLAFTGLYGTGERWQYTLVGSVMNRGARLAQAAGGRVLCDTATRAAASRRSSISFAALPPLELKGIAEPVTVWAPVDAQQRPATGERVPGDRVVGRSAERAVLDAALDALADRAGGGVVLLEGEAGIGKSRLAAAGLERAAGLGMRRLVGQGQQLEQGSVLHGWRPVFEELLDVDARTTDPDALRDLVRRGLDARQVSPDLLPLLNPVLPTGLPETELTKAMPAESRADATRELLTSLVREAAESTPTVLLVEDVHWLDSTSLELLVAVADSVPELLVVATARPAEAGSPETPEARRRLGELAGARRITLGAMEEAESVAVIRHILGVDHVDAEVATVVHERADGNPFFCEQLALALRDYGVVRIESGRCVPASAFDDVERSLDEHLVRQGLPGTLQGVIGSRIDRLDDGPRLAVKLASVVGPRFELDGLESIHPEGATGEELSGWLDELVHLDIVGPDPSAPQAAFTFRHAILRDVVYNSLSFARRETTHAGVAEWLERDGGGELARNYPLLAHHWTRAGVRTKATTYLALAGGDALERYANREAVRFFEEAIALDEEAGGEKAAPGGERAAWELQLGAAHVNWSRYDEAREHLARGLALNGHRAPGSLARDGLGLSGELGRQVIHRLRAEHFVGRDRDSAEELRRLARAYESLVEAFYLDNATLPCLLSAVRSLNLAELAGPSAELARAYASFGAILGFVPARRLADAYFRRALRTADLVGEPSARAWVGLAAGVYAIGGGDWEAARRHLAQTRDTAERLGDRRRWDDALQNLAAVDFLLGRYRDSAAAAEQLHGSANERKDERGLVVALRRRALCLLATGETDELPDCVERLEQLREHTGDLYRDLPPLALAAQLHLRENRPGEAFETAAAALAIIREATPTFHDSLSDFFNVAQVVLSLDLAASRGEFEAHDDLPSMSRDACRALRKYARVFSIGRPYALLCEGVRQHARGHPNRAVSRWRQAIVGAREMGLERCEGLARLELGRVESGDGGEHLARAAEIFQRLGAAYESRLVATARAHG